MHWENNRAESGERGRMMEADFYGGGSVQGGDSQKVGEPPQATGNTIPAIGGNAISAPSGAGLRGTLLGGSEGGELGQQASKNRPPEAGKAEFGGNELSNTESGKNESRTGESAHAVPLSPDGYVFDFSSSVAVDEQALAAFKEVACEQGISQQQAASIASLYAELVEQQAAGEQATLAESEEAWLKELRQGRYYAKTVASARLTMERFGSPELNDLLNETRLGSHPALVRFVAKIGEELGEPVFMRGKGHGKTGKLNFYETMEG